jgi:predicted enzyme related to lactoylglutathione lyase
MRIRLAGFAIRTTRQGRAWLLGLGLALGAPAGAASWDLPPLADPATGEHHAGKVIWNELVTPDLQGAQRFYGAMFGWTFREAAATPASGRAAVPTRYAVALQDGAPVAGLLQRESPSGKSVRPAWMPFFAVADVDEVRRKAHDLGASILAEPRDYGRRGRQAILADPEGAVFAILNSPSGDTPDELAAPGQWIWSSLLVRDADKDAGFYQAVLGYEVFDLPSTDGRDHLILSSDELARASVNSMPDDSPRRHPHWLGFVRVADAADAASRAQDLGGRALVPAHADRHGGRVAVLADPQGAVFGVMEWSETFEQGQPK